MALFRCGNGGSTSVYVTSHEGSEPLTVDISQYENILFFVGYGANNRLYDRGRSSMTVNEFLTTHSGSVTVGSAGFTQTVSYANGTFTLGQNANINAGVVIILS